MSVDVHTLLQRIASAPPSSEEVDAMLDDLARGDPMVAQLVAMMRARRTEAADVIDAPAQVVDAPRSMPGTEPERARRARTNLAALVDELDRLRATQERLADALGACARCWGEDARCPACAGRGCPGHRAPDERLYAYFIIPASKRMQPPSSANRVDSPHPKEQGP